MAEAQRKTRPRLNIDRLVANAERYMTMSGLTPTAAVRKAMPEELLAIPMDDMRTLCESALVQRLAQRRSRDRYRDTAERAEVVQKMTQEALHRINDAAAHKAEVLARVTYIVDGTPTPLLAMTVETHISRQREAQRQQKSAAGRRDFHAAAAKTLKAAKKERIADLSVAQITKLAEQAEAVWGASED